METKTTEAAVDHVIQTVGKQIKLGLPLGLGKPNVLVNALYNRAKSDPTLSLVIYTALSLERPQPDSGVKGRLTNPIYDRLFNGYVELEYMKDLRNNQVPDNIQIHEFFFKSGALLQNNCAQQNYISTNYTHVSRDIDNLGINVLAQMVAKRTNNGVVELSLSCNPEVSLDLVERLKARPEKNYITIAQVNDHLPFMPNSARVDIDEFDLLIEENAESRLFTAPNPPIQEADYMIGLYCAALIADAGTLQIGIGSLGDAIAQSCILRHKNNAVFNAIHEELNSKTKFGSILLDCGGFSPFEQGIYGCSEMLTNGLLHLFEHQIIKRNVYHNQALQDLLSANALKEAIQPGDIKVLLNNNLISNPITLEDLEFLTHYGYFKPGCTLESNQIIAPNGEHFYNDLTQSMDKIIAHCLDVKLRNGYAMDCGFFLGPSDMYHYLRNCDPQQLNKINMTHISFVNHLYGNEMLKRAHRTKARFMNSVFLANCLGASTSDGLESGRVVSGVGGQYNFVAQAQELEGARSILVLRSTRTKHGNTTSNIVWNYGHTTIPRHLRDIYVTEYGIADVRGKCDSDVVAAMINIADSRFQNNLVEQAIAAGKLPHNYKVPAAFRNNTPDSYTSVITRFKESKHLPSFPFGTDLTDLELDLAKALKHLEQLSHNKLKLIRTLLSRPESENLDGRFKPYLERLSLEAPESLKEKALQQLVIHALSETGAAI